MNSFTFHRTVDIIELSANYSGWKYGNYFALCFQEQPLALWLPSCFQPLFVRFPSITDGHWLSTHQVCTHVRLAHFCIFFITHIWCSLAVFNELLCEWLDVNSKLQTISLTGILNPRVITIHRPCCCVYVAKLCRPISNFVSDAT